VSLARRWLAGGAVAVLTVLGGCGYSMRPLSPVGVRTVAVEVIENPTFWRDLEFQLTEDLKNAILSRTDLLIVEKDRADVLLSGKIVNFIEQVLVEDPIDDVLESSVIVTADFVLKDLRTGNERSRVRLTDTAEFVVGSNENVNSATAEAFSDLSEKVIYSLLEEPF